MSYLNSELNVNWITAALALVACVIIYGFVQWAQLPPGPKGLPYLGYYPFIRTDFPLQFQNMTKKYGDVFCIRCCGQLYVYLGSNRAIKEAHVTKSHCFVGRSKSFSMFTDTFGGGVLGEDGEKWKELRKFFVQRLKEFVPGKKTPGGSMKDFLEETVSTIRKSDGEDFNVFSFLLDICTRLIYSMILSGYKVDEDDVRAFNEAYAVTTECMFGTNIFLTGPLAKLMTHVHPVGKRYRRSKLIVDTVIAKIIKDHEKTFDKDNIRNMVDYYISMRKQLEGKKDHKHQFFTVKALHDSLVQFIGDGGFFVGFTISLILKKLLDRPDMQKEIQHEIDCIVGHSRFPSWDDRSKMPYTNAVIQECFRTTDVIPVLPGVECIQETTLGNCRVPKGAVTLMGIWAACHDPVVYEQPEKFDPTRFMPGDDQKIKCTLPPLFGVGKRSCIGESLVLMETFIFLSTILQNFDLNPAMVDKSEAPASSKRKETEFGDLNVVFRATPRNC